MAFSVTTVTHSFANPDTTPASGKVVFSLTKRMSNGGTSVLPGSVTATLNASGQISQTLYANADAATVPADAQWRVDIQILGAEEESYFITVPTTGPVDLASLLPVAA